jgi:hypothetical protein
MTGPSWTAVWTLVFSVIAAVVGSATALLLKRRRDRLRAQLDFVNSQLRYFYGPLLATAEASEQAWSVFKARYNPEAEPGTNFWDPAHSPTREARTAYKHWINTLFIPLDDKMVEIISARADLLIEPGMPQCLTDLCGHTLSLKAALAMWNVTSGGAPDAPDYPAKALLEYLEDSFSALKNEQVRLLKAITSSKAYPLTESTRSVSLISDSWKSLERGTVRDPRSHLSSSGEATSYPLDADQMQVGQ